MRRPIVEHFGLNGGVYTTPESFGYANGYCKSFLPNESYTKTYYVSSLYNLMLTALGVDLDGNEISLGHDKYEAYTDFKNVLAINAANPWNGKSNLTFNKNNFFEYQLSKVFKEDPKLMIEAEKVCSCYFKGMSYYREMSQLFDEKGDSYSDRVCKYLAKDHLMLAYYFSANLRYLWAAAKSNMAFNAVIETAEIAPEYVLDVLGAVWPEFPTATKFLYSVLSSKPDTSSFMNVWNTIKEKLLQNGNCS